MQPLPGSAPPPPPPSPKGQSHQPTSTHSLTSVQAASQLGSTAAASPLPLRRRSTVQLFKPAPAPAEMRRRGGLSSPLAAPVALLLILLVCFFHRAAAARPLPVPLQVHQGNGVRVVAEDDEPAVLQRGAAGSGDGLSLSVSDEVVGAEEEPATECGEGDDDGCLQRRLLRDAHLDYIYTQHKGKP